MDDLLKRRLVGAAVLVLGAFALASLLPGPDRKPGAGDEPVVAYDLRTGRALNAGPVEPPPPPVRLKPAEIGSSESLAAEVAEAPAAREPAKEPPALKPAPQKPVADPKASPAPAPQATADGKPVAKPAPKTGKFALKVDESFNSSGGNWFVQVASFPSKDTARTEQMKLAKLGLPAMVTAASVGKKTWFRVRLGPYGSESTAQQALSSAKAKGYPEAKVVRPDASAN